MNYITTNSTVSIGTQVHNPTIMEAKTYLKNEFDNKYDITPHFTFLIMAMPEYRAKDVEQTLDKFLAERKTLDLSLGVLHFETKQKFFSIPIIGDETMKFHKELISVLNPLRDNHIREKDLERMNEHKTDELENEYIEKYGYLRVLDKFIPHITIGNIQKSENFNLDIVKQNLDNILNSLYNSPIKVNNLIVKLYEDADIQSNYKWIWEKDYTLR